MISIASQSIFVRIKKKMCRNIFFYIQYKYNFLFITECQRTKIKCDVDIHV